MLNHFDHTRINRLIHHKKRVTFLCIDPIVCGGSEAPFLTGDMMPGSFGLIPIIDPYVTINIKHTSKRRRRLHPLLTQRFTPWLHFGLVSDQYLYFLTPCAHVGDTVQANDFAPLAGGAITQAFDGFDPTKCHKSQQKKNAVNAVIAFGESKKKTFYL